jgi:hypothetical protein
LTVCNDKKGTDESIRVASARLGANAGSIGASAAMAGEGAVIVQITD